MTIESMKQQLIVERRRRGEISIEIAKLNAQVAAINLEIASLHRTAADLDVKIATMTQGYMNVKYATPEEKREAFRDHVAASIGPRTVVVDAPTGAVDPLRVHMEALLHKVKEELGVGAAKGLLKDSGASIMRNIPDYKINAVTKSANRLLFAHTLDRSEREVFDKLCQGETITPYSPPLLDAALSLCEKGIAQPVPAILNTFTLTETARKEYA